MTKVAATKDNDKQQEKEKEQKTGLVVKYGETYIIGPDDFLNAKAKAKEALATARGTDEEGGTVKPTSSKMKASTSKTSIKKPKRTTTGVINKEHKRKDSLGHQGHTHKPGSKDKTSKTSKSKQSVKSTKTRASAPAKANEQPRVYVNIENLTIVAPTEAQKGGGQDGQRAQDSQGSPARAASDLSQPNKDSAKPKGN